MIRRFAQRALVCGGAAVLGVTMLSAQPAAAAEMATTYTAPLSALNGSGTTGAVSVAVEGNMARVELRATGASPSLPHAQHIHIGGANVCPTPAADENGDGIIDGKEGVPAYGGVKVSLTTTGDVSASSALAVPRFPVADASGDVTYFRTFELPAGVTAADVANGVVVQHGISELFADPTAYDGEPRSSLDPSLPLEATVPTSCGKLISVAGGDDVAEIGRDAATAVTAALVQVSTMTVDATEGIEDGAALDEFGRAYVIAFETYGDTVSGALEQFEKAVADGKNLVEARNQLINTLDSAKAQLLNELHQAKDRFNDALNGSNVSAEEKNEFNNQFNSALGQLNNSLELVKNEFIEDFNQATN